MKLKQLLLAALLLASGAANAQLLTKFGPVNGVLVGTVNNPQTAAATSTTIIGLWSGCTGSNFLRGDGTCTVPAGTGVTSVAQTVPAGFSVAGSPITSTGTLAISYATGQTANRVLATPDGTTGALSLRALVAGDIPPINLGSTANGGVSSATILLGTNGGTSNGFFSVTGPTTALRTFTFPNASATVLTTNALVTVSQGGIGVGTLTGIAKGNGTSAFTAAASSDVISLWTGTCSSTTFLRGDGACASAGGGAVGGSNTQIQYNNSGVFGGTAGLTWDNVNNKLNLAVASAGGDYFNISSTNTSFIGASLGVSTGHTFAVRAGTTGFFIADGTNGTNPISFDNSGTVTIAAAAATHNGLVSQTSGGVGSAAFTASAAIAGFVWQAPANAADQKNIQCYYNGGALQFNCTFVNDAGSAEKQWLSATRGTGTVVTGVALGNNTDVPTITGNGAAMTPRQGTFTMTYNGFSAGNSLTATYYAIGNQVTLLIPGSAVSTSNATTFTATGIPATIQPAQAQQVPLGAGSLCEDNGAIGGFSCTANLSGGTLTFSKNNNASGWTASGQKGITTNFAVSYLLN